MALCPDKILIILSVKNRHSAHSEEQRQPASQREIKDDLGYLSHPKFEVMKQVLGHLKSHSCQDCVFFLAHKV